MTGTFKNRDGSSLRWEVKNGRILLWWNSTLKLLDLSTDEATEAYFQLYEKLRDAGVSHDLISFR